MTILPIALTTTACAALINLWLGIRIGRLRTKEKLFHGDGGNDRLGARMRAHLNFAEYVPVVLILIGLIELAVGSPLWLWIIALLFVAARVAHVFGMDGWLPGRMAGFAVTALAMAGLAVFAVLIPYLYLPH